MVEIVNSFIKRYTSIRNCRVLNAEFYFKFEFKFKHCAAFCKTCNFCVLLFGGNFLKSLSNLRELNASSKCKINYVVPEIAR